MLWHRAITDVETWLDADPATSPGFVYSAPIEVRQGQQVEPTTLDRVLLDAGYERVGTPSAPNQFSRDGGRFEVHTGKRSGLRDVASSKTTITITDGVVSRPNQATLAPAVLAVMGNTDQRRDPVDLDALSPWLEPAVLAMEDARFRTHHGVDPIGVARALLHNLWSDGGMHGGSTITQQLAKNLFLSPDRTVRRKVREAFFAAALESKLAKDEILEIYLGEVYLGQHRGVPLHGVEQASRAWFGSSASQLTLAQAATIAGVISAPNAYAPARHPEVARERRDLVLDRMTTLGTISDEQREAASRQPVHTDGTLPGADRSAPWAVDAALDVAEATVGVGSLADGGYALHTTIDPLLQHAAEQAVRGGMAELVADYPKALGAQIALVAVRVSDGAIVAMVGGRDYSASQFNRATSAWRQAGSTVKPLTMLAAFDADRDRTPLDVLSDTPIALEIDGRPWAPTNYDGRFVGDVTLRRAMEGSRNVPAVLLAQSVGWGELQRGYKRAGLSRATRYPSAALGSFETTPVELAGAFTAFPGGGTAHQPYIAHAVGLDGTRISLVPRNNERRLASARAAAMSTAVLQGVITAGTGARARRHGIDGSVGGKTGTTNAYRDAWFVGFTPTLAVAVWVGRDQGDGIGLSGSRAALPTWSRFVVASGTQSGSLPQPDSVHHVTICTESELPARPGCDQTYAEVVSTSASLTEPCDVHGGPVVEVSRALRSWLPKIKKR